MADYGVHKATRNVKYGPYDPLDFELEPVLNPDAVYGPSSVDPFPNNSLPATSAVDLAAMSRNKPK